MFTSLPAPTRSLRKPANNNKLEAGRLSEQTLSSSTKAVERSIQLPTVTTRRSTTNPANTHPPSKDALVSGGRSSLHSSLLASSLQQCSNAASKSRLTRVNSVHEQDRSKPPVTKVSNSTLQGNGRLPGHTRNKSSSALLSSTATLRPPSRSNEEDTFTRGAQAERKRPAFSTLQQHFSPARRFVSKPHPAAFFAPPSPSKLPSNIAISAETARLQSELLQLHLLHRDAAQVESEWRISAEKKLGAKFQVVVRQNEQLAQLEDEEMARLNAVALQTWQELGSCAMRLEDKIQVLSEVLTAVWNLGDSGGKYQRLVRTFEIWMSRCQTIRDLRGSDDAFVEEGSVFIEELDDKWKDDCTAIKRKLEFWQDQLRELGIPEHGSSVTSVVEGCQNLVQGVLGELSFMAQIEHDVLACENAWIIAMNDQLMNDEVGAPVAGAAWRMHHSMVGG